MSRIVKNKMFIAVVISATVLLAILASIIISPSFAYFRALFDKNGYHNMIIELIFDRLDEEGMVAYTAKYQDVYGSDFSPNSDAEWGTIDNPYVISQKYHVQNLSVLQNIGFFENRVDESGEPIQSYFLVCNPDGTPVVIDCGGISIAPIGNHKHPFTGVISGAPDSGESSYKSYGTTVSGIANLTVESTLDDPDIGFFGKLGYYGNKTTETNSFGVETSYVDGYAAYVDNILFADVTVKSTRSLSQILADWWAELTGHLHYEEAWKETHHVGIIAGHAEFATLKDISVYYSSDSIAAFNLVSNDGESNTNYYSATGLIGLLDCVNPTVNSDGVLDGSDAISDSVLVGDGTGGGGGEQSGTMTGYFLAKNLYDRHEDYLSEEIITTKDKYSVSEMREMIGEKESAPIFKTVTMRERDEGGSVFNPDRGWEYYNYFYFQDTVFTFAMTTKVPANSEGVATGPAVDDKVDYVQKVWRIDEEARPSISSAETLDNLQYGPDPDATPPVSYRLKAANSLTDKGYYVLAYHDTADNCLYLIDLTDTQGTQRFTRKIPLDNNGEIVLGVSYANATDIATIDLKGIQQNVYDYAFQYVVQDSSTASIKRPNDEYKLGITSSGDYSSASTAVSNAANNGGNYDGDAAFVHYWSFQKDASSNKFRVTGKCTFGGRYLLIFNNYKYYWSKLSFNTANGSIGFVNNVYNSESSRNSAYNSATFSSTDYFTVFQVQANTYDDAGNITNEEETGNKLLASKNIFPDEDFYDFDPSKYVLQFDPGDSDDVADDSYKLVPIRSLKLNNGQGELLTELNHIVKLAQTTPSNFQLQIGNLVGGIFGETIGGWAESITATNTGGVVNTTIGTFNKEIYSIPTGMIAFEINEASKEKPSYINIIVAIEPDQESVGRVGLWKMNRTSWSDSFDINGYEDAFMLPVSKTATSPDDIRYAIKVSERIVETEENGKRLYNVVTNTDGSNETSYLYLGGDVAFVYYTFEITDISEETVFMLGSLDGPLSVAYFSVTGAAGEGNDGMSGSPLGNVDFVYDYNGEIITADKHYVGEAPLLDLEDYNNYYPSYLFVGMLPENNKIQHEVVFIRRYIEMDEKNDAFGTRRHIIMRGEIYTTIRPVSPVMEDYQDDIDDG